MSISVPFTILSHSGEVVFVDPKNIEDKCGQCHQDELIVRIKEGMADDIAGTTLIHELIHVIEFLTHIELKEREIDCLALGLYSFLKENPHLVEWLLLKEEEEGQEDEASFEEAKEVSPYCSWAPSVYGTPRSPLSGVGPNIG